MPKLASWYSSLASQGLVVIGAHAQGGTEKKIKSTALSHGANFTIMTRATVKDGNDFSGIPHCMLFDHTGKCVYRGAPQSIEPLLRKTVNDAPPAILEGKKLSKLANYTASLKLEKNYGVILTQLKGKVSDKDATTAEEATYIVEKLTERGRQLLDEAKEKRDTVPQQAWNTWNRVATNYRGTDLGKEATAAIDEAKKDKTFVTDIGAYQSLDKLRAFEGQLKPVGNEFNPDTQAFKNQNAGILTQMTIVVKQMKKAAPESSATKEALDMATTYNLRVN